MQCKLGTKLHVYVLNLKLALCPSISTPAYAKRLGDPRPRQPVGASITFECMYSYQLNGSATITCQSDGEWNSSTPTCNFGNTIAYFSIFND